MQLIPAVDVLDGNVVRLTRGDYDTVTVYGTDPAVTAHDFVDRGAALVHVVDLAGARDGTHDRALWGRLAASGVPFQVGGGIRDGAVAVAAIGAGARRVVVGTAAVWEPAALAEIVAAIGADRVVAALDVRDGRATGAGWRDDGLPLEAVVDAILSAGVRRALVTGIRTDGTLAGPDLAVIARVQEAAPDLAVIGSGGVGSIADLVALSASGVEGAIVGRALYEGRFTLEEALAALSG